MSQRVGSAEERAKLEKRVAVVTGAASGIGLGVSRRLAEAGYPVAMLDVQDELLKQVVKELRPIAIMVTNAGIDANEAFASISVERWNRVLAINLTGTFNCIQSAIPD